MDRAIKLFQENTVPAVYCHVTVWRLILSIYPRRAMSWQMQYHPVQCMSLAWSILDSKRRLRMSKARFVAQWLVKSLLKIHK